MNTELTPKDGEAVAHWALGMSGAVAFGVTACGLVSSGGQVKLAENVADLSCRACLAYVSKLDGRIFCCDVCDRYWLGFEDADLHMLSHED